MANRLMASKVIARWQRTVVRCTAVAAVGVTAIAVGSAPAMATEGPTHLDSNQFSIASFTTASSSMQAGGHPDVNTKFALKSEDLGGGSLYPYGLPRRVEVDLPAGLVGDPTKFPACSLKDLYTYPFDSCAPASQVGTAIIEVGAGFFASPSPVYNMEHGADEPALLGINVGDVGSLYSFIQIESNSDGLLTAVVDEIPTAHPLVSSDLTLWGVPADHNGSGAPRVPFMTGPTECETIPTTKLRVYTYDGKSDSAVSQLQTPPEGCDLVPFEPVMSATPTSREAAGPTGLDVEINVPQRKPSYELAAAHVKQVQIALPEGMKVSPSSAGGLEACAPAQFGYHSESAVTCPDGSKIGTVSVKSPLLTDPLQGSVYLAKQNDNPFSSLLAMYMVVQGNGVTIKLAGRVDPDPITGRLTATFDNNPQLPFEQLDVQLKSGPRAPLTNPQTCGVYQSETTITSWSGKSVSASTPMTIDQDCQPVGFSPTFNAGTVNPVGGGSSTFSLTFARGDHDQELRDITVDMPAGLTGKIANADLCPDAMATAGSCGESARIGSLTTSAGPGSNPFSLPGRAYITGPYKGAPFGMSLVVPAVAGPFDLGTVVVRAAVFVDRHNASLRVVSDPMPRILQGIPLQVRSVNVAIDKPGFMINPTSCAAKEVLGRITSQQGAGADVKSRFQVGNCAQLPLKPTLTLEVGTRAAKKTAATPAEMRDGGHPEFHAHLTMPEGNANNKKVTVTLPLSLALDPDNANALCEPTAAATDSCPAASIVGQVHAKSPILRGTLDGPVYFVRGERKDAKTGRIIRTLPKLYVPLSASDYPGLKIDLNASSDVKSNRLVTTFDNIPDAPVSEFDLTITGGKHGILAVSNANLCTSAYYADADFSAQNGKALRLALESRIAVVPTRCPLAVVASSHTATKLNVKLGGLSAGKITISGNGLTKTSRTIASATSATLAATMSKSVRSRLARGRDVKIKVAVSFTPKGSKKATKISKTLTIHGTKKN